MQKHYIFSGSLCPLISFSDVSYSVSFVIRGIKGLTRVFSDGTASEVAERVPDTVLSLRTSKPAGRDLHPVGRA